MEYTVCRYLCKDCFVEEWEDESESYNDETILKL